MSRKLSLLLLLAAVVGTGVLFFRVIQPFLFSLLFAAVLAVLFRPAYQFMEKLCRGHRRVASGLTTAIIILTILLPIGGAMVLAGGQLLELGRDVVQWVNEPEQSSIGRTIEKVRESRAFGWVLEVRAALTPEQEQELKKLVSKAIDNAANDVYEKTQAFLADMVAFVIGFVVMALALYYLFADGPALLREAKDLSPLEEEDEQELLEQFDKVCRGVVMGNVMAALVQGILAGIAFAIVGIDWLWLGAGLTVLFSLLPFLGAATVWIVVAITLLVDGHYGSAIFMVIYGTIVISTSDNLIKAYVIGGESKIHPLVVLIAVLGALKLIGLWGIFIGPMIAAFFYALLKILWKRVRAHGNGEVRENGSAVTEGSSSV
jgi:predicted PurR-regulated permease PerM